MEEKNKTKKRYTYISKYIFYCIIIINIPTINEQETCKCKQAYYIEIDRVDRQIERQIYSLLLKRRNEKEKITIIFLGSFNISIEIIYV